MPNAEKFNKIRQQILSGTRGIIARHINKKISLPISFWLARHTKIRPNQITYFNILLGLCAFPIAAHGTYLSLAIAGVILQIASILDGVDGEVAKWTGQATKWGQWLDTISDNLTIAVFLAGVSIGVYRLYPHAGIPSLSLITFAGFILIIATMIVFLRKDTRSGSFVTYDKEFLQKTTSHEFPVVARVIHVLKYMIKKDFFSFLFCILAVIGKPLWILYVSSSGVTIACFFIMYINIFRKLHQTRPTVQDLSVKKSKEIEEATSGSTPQ